MWLSASNCSSEVLFQSSDLTGSVRVRVNFDGCLVQQHISAHQCILGIHMRVMCLAQSTWKVWNGDGRSMVETMPCCASVYPVHGSASKVNCSDADAQVVFCHGCLVFHPFVEQLTVFYVSGLVRRCLLSSESSTSMQPPLHHIAMASWASRAKQVHKLCLNPYISTVNP